MTTKIVELQGLRCVAIVSVLLFHVLPNNFPNGFLGVDVFFVISGYIMALILLSFDSLKTSFIETTLNFYYRRVYRILPLYLLNILTTVSIIPVISYTAAIDFEEVKSLLTFTKNFKELIRQTNYFWPGSRNDLFLHYWSLCVEMQFYLIVPFLLYLSKRIPNYVNLFILWPSLIAACVALIFYLLGNHGFYGGLFTFYMLPARCYEFAGGFIAFYAQSFIEEKSQNCKYMLKFKAIFQNFVVVNILTAVLLAVVLCPIKLIDIYSLATTVIITSAIIVSIGKTEKADSEMEYSILANSVCVLIGNASYSMYIFHWIFIIFHRIRLNENSKYAQVILGLCLIFGIIIHKCIEKPIIKARLEPKKFVIRMIFAYFFVYYVAYYSSKETTISDYGKEIFYNKSRLIIDSEQWKNVAEGIKPDISAEIGRHSVRSGCSYHPKSEYAKSFKTNTKYPPSIKDQDIWGSESKEGTGNLSILIIGNSHGSCAIPAIELALSGLYSEINLVSVGGATPFEGFERSYAAYIFKDVVEHYKPDIIFLIFAYVRFDDPPTEPIETDSQTKSVQKMITFLSNNSKAVFISEKSFIHSNFSATKFAEEKLFNGWANDYLVKQQDIENEHKVSSRRWKAIHCKNCIFFNVLDTFCKNGWCSPIDETGTVPLLSDTNHLSIFGSYKLSKSIKKNVKQMFDFIERNNTHSN